MKLLGRYKVSELQRKEWRLSSSLQRQASQVSYLWGCPRGEGARARAAEVHAALGMLHEPMLANVIKLVDVYDSGVRLG